MKKRSKLLFLALFVILLTCILSIAIMAISYSDVDTDDYYYYSVNWATKNEITNGTSSNTFSPNDVCTRGQIVTLLWRLNGCVKSQNKACVFIDVKNDDYYYDAVLWAVENNITNGTTNTTFSPNNPATREDCVTFLYRFSNTIEETKTANVFLDVSSNDYFYQPILWAIKNKITMGVEKNMFGTGEYCTRAQTITFLYRYTQIDVRNKSVMDEMGEEALSAFSFGNQTAITQDEEGIKLSYEPDGNTVNPYVFFNIRTYCKQLERENIKAPNGQCIVIKFKQKNTDGTMEIFNNASTAGTSSVCFYNSFNDNDWQYAVLDMTNTSLGSAKFIIKLQLDWSGPNTKAGAYMIISEIGMFKSSQEAYEYYQIGSVNENKETSISNLKIEANSTNDDYIYFSSNKIEKQSDVTNGSYYRIKNAIGNTKTNIVLDVESILKEEKNGLSVGRYIGFVLQEQSTKNGKVILNSITTTSNEEIFINKEVTLVSSNVAKGVYFDIGSLSERLLENDHIKTIQFSISNENSTGYVDLYSIISTSDLNEVLKGCGREELSLGQLPDYFKYEKQLKKVDAEYEDESVELWFDVSTVKKLKTDTTSSGIYGYKMVMAKNEQEGCQFFVSTNEDREFRIEIDEISNGFGKVLAYEINYEHYFTVLGKQMPDALPVLNKPITVSAGTSQGFYIKIRSEKATQAGDYATYIRIIDNDTGKEVKKGILKIHVYDITLSDETTLKTAFAIWRDNLRTSYSGTGYLYSMDEVYENYYEFFAKNRISVTDVPNGVNSTSGKKYLQDPRINTARIELGETVDYNYSSKLLYYIDDEPKFDSSFKLIAEHYASIVSENKNPRIVIPFWNNHNLTNAGQITTFENSDCDAFEYLSRYMNIFCIKFEALTDRNLSFVSNVSFMQSVEQDERYGKILDRLQTQVDNGGEFWSYICNEPNQPYVNWQLTSDLSETIVSSWLCKKYNSTGLLYWSVNIWDGNYFTTNSMSGDYLGDGILIYSGGWFNSDEPISTLRLENIREGIEDYQLLCMLENKVGQKETQKIVDMVSTSVVTYLNDNEQLSNVRAYLYDCLNEAINGK